MDFPEEYKKREFKRALNLNQLLHVIPHRDPILMIDDILDYEPGIWAIGHKHLTGEELFWKGHFPSKPIMPGTMQLEALSQVAVFTILSDRNDDNDIGIFAEAKEVRFYEMVPPGEDLFFYCILHKARMGIYKFSGFAEMRTYNKCLSAEMTLTTIRG